MVYGRYKSKQSKFTIRLLSDTFISGTDLKELCMITILALTGSSSQMLITYQIQSLCDKDVWARDKNIHQSDLSNYRMFVPKLISDNHFLTN